MQKIVITGGLGYIGSELCKLYSGEARFKKIVVIDKRFASERVKQLRDWGMEFVHASIMDGDAMKTHLKDADVVIHLAGVTDVPCVKGQSNTEVNREISEVGINGTLNIIDAVNSECKIIFPSTHVIYEGLAETTIDIDETIRPCPVLAYAKSKVESEYDLKQSGKNYVILRLASVYGYSTDTMRTGIMPNLFSMIASQNGTIKLHSGGVQLKSLVPVYDVARCMKFMAENPAINREVFNLSKDTATVKEVAELCQKINPKTAILTTSDEIPNKGSTISNKKLLATGFTFLYDLETCIREMITNWSEKPANPDLEYIDRGGNTHVDDRGVIHNYELTEPINLIGMITTVKGAVRANHYHPVQEQKCLLVKGQYISVIQDLSKPDAPIETRLINEGDVAIIKPNVAHAMVFTEDSVFLNLVRGDRDHENYGITHTIPHKLVDDALRDKLLESYKTSCRVCGQVHLGRVVSLGNSPLANNLKPSVESPENQYPLEVNFCPSCKNCQLSVVVPAGKMFDNYLYVSSTTTEWRKHFEDVAEKYIEEFGLDASSLVVDIGSNDGVALKPLQKRGIRVLGVEPAVNIARIANQDGIPTRNDYFDKECVSMILRTEGKARLVTATNVYAHADDLKGIALNVFDLLGDGGSFIVEVQYLLNTITDCSFDNIYHEHVNYWSVTSIRNFFNSLGLVVYRVEKLETHGGSIRVYVRRPGVKVEACVDKFLYDEHMAGLHKTETYKKFGEVVASNREIVRQNVQALKKAYPIIAGFGSPAKATTALNYYGIDSQTMAYTIEDNVLKWGKFIPGVNIPIKGPEYARNNPPNCIIVLAWNFFDLIVKNNKDKFPGVKFISARELQDPTFAVKNRLYT